MKEFKKRMFEQGERTMILKEGGMSNNIFEQIKKVNEYGKEYWSSRDLSKLLGYTESRLSGYKLNNCNWLPSSKLSSMSAFSVSS